MRKLSVYVASLMLCGCTTLQSLDLGLTSETALAQRLAAYKIADINRALMIANAENDQSGILCLTQIEKIVGYATPTDNMPIGLFTAIEIVRVVRRNGILSDCVATLNSTFMGL